MMTPIDAVLRRPEDGGIALRGSLPIGLLAPIRYQPYLGGDREQVFVCEGFDGARLLVWRIADEEPTGASESVTRFLVTPLVDDEWPGLLDATTSVRDVLERGRSGAVVSFAHRLDGGGIEIRPSGKGDLPSGADLPEETVRDPETGEEKPNRVFWLGLPAGVLLRPGSEMHAEELEKLASWERSTPSATATKSDGTVVSAFQHLIVSEDPDGTREVRRYPRQLDALVAVERAELP